MYFRANKKRVNEISLSETIDTDKDGDALFLLDTIGEDDLLLSNLQDREEAAAVRTLVSDCLDEREREIITLRYGLNGGTPLAQREVAAKLGISRSYISRLEKKALEKLEDGLKK